jgi:hypothetical protein
MLHLYSESQKNASSNLKTGAEDASEASVTFCHFTIQYVTSWKTRLFVNRFEDLWHHNWRHYDKRHTTTSKSLKKTRFLRATACTAMESRFDSHQEKDSSPYQLWCSQWVPGALSIRIKRPGHEANNTPPSSAEIKNIWSYTSTPPHVFMA